MEEIDKKIEELTKKLARIEEIERNIEELKKLQTLLPFHYYPPIQYIPYTPPAYNPNIHYHGSIPCYNNPCVWF
jgi:ribosome biogenesis GTPase A